MKASEKGAGHAMASFTLWPQVHPRPTAARWAARHRLSFVGIVPSWSPENLTLSHENDHKFESTGSFAQDEPCSASLLRDGPQPWIGWQANAIDMVSERH